MGGAAFRFITRRPSLLLLRHFSSHLLRSPLHPPLHPVLPSVLKCSQQLHSDSDWKDNPNSSNFDQHQHQHVYQHPWSEFSDFVEWLYRSGYHNTSFVSNDVRFVDAEELCQQFLYHGSACLEFARNNPTLIWSLPRDNLCTVAIWGSAHLFSNASAARARMEFFLRDEANNVLDSDKPSTIDLMEILLSSAYVATLNPQKFSRDQPREFKLFSALAKSKGNSLESVATTQKQFSETYKQAPRSFGERIEMQKGDWIIRRCCFEVKCPHCEWKCPQCDFCNSSLNMACLRCDCKRIETNRFMNRDRPWDIKDGPEVKQLWFTKIRRLENSSDMNNPLSDSDLPKTFKGGDSRFADELIGEKPESGTQAHARFQQQSSNAKFPSQMENKDDDVEPAEKSERWFETALELQDMKNLSNDISDDDFPEIMPMRKGENRFVVGKKKDRSLTSPMNKRRAAMEQPGNNKNVPFVTYLPGYFPRNIPQERSEFTESSENTGSVDTIEDKTSTVFEPPNNDESPKSFVSQSSSPDKNSKPQSMSEIREAFAAKYFPDEDFPSIMPMRKGVSKRKTPLEKRLASAQSRSNLPDVSNDPKRKETDSD